MAAALVPHRILVVPSGIHLHIDNPTGMSLIMARFYIHGKNSSHPAGPLRSVLPNDLSLFVTLCTAIPHKFDLFLSTSVAPINPDSVVESLCVNKHPSVSPSGLASCLVVE